MSTARAETWVPQETFGTRLAMLRHQLTLNQKDCARMCGIDDASWSNWERGVSTPRNMADVVRRIHAATGVDMGWLMWGTAPTPTGVPADNEEGASDLPKRSSAWTTAVDSADSGARVIPLARTTVNVDAAGRAA